MKILMVCLGNICRSPLAEGILRDLAEQNGLSWTIDSAGTGSWHVGQQPDERSIATASKHGIDIRQQRARQFHFPDFEAYDVIYAMDTSNYADIVAQAENEAERAKVKLILDELGQGSHLSVPDPYWNDDGFEQVYQMLHEACAHIIDRHG